MKNKVVLRLIIPPVLIIAFTIYVIVSISTKNSPSPPPSGWVLQTDLQTQLRGRSIKDMTFTDSVTGYAVTPWINNDSSFIFKTTNGGDNWFAIVSNSYQQGGFNQIKFLNSQTGFTAGSYLLKTTNSGMNWIIIIPAGIWPNKMTVLNEDTIYCADPTGLDGGVFRTTNGGVNWEQLWNGGNENPEYFYMYNVRIGFMRGAGGAYKTTDGGYNWFSIGEYNYGDIYFLDSLTGYMAIGIVKKTTNGGINWIDQTLPNVPGGTTAHWIQKFFFFGRDTIWAVGSHVQYHNPNRDRGIINKTTNGGLNWGYQLPDTHLVQIPEYELINFCNKNYGWAYNIFGKGIKTTTGGDSTIYMGINNNITSISGDYILFQNYPNPFNPETNIKYTLKKSEVRSQKSEVELIVYDVSGKRVTILVKEQQNQGDYEVIFSGNNLSSGIYFYSLFVDGVRIDTKKLILLK